MKPKSLSAARQWNQFELETPSLRKQNTFDLSHDHKTTFNMGELIPFLTLETLPGDRFTIGNEVLIRFAPLVLPIMHRCDINISYFYVPNRILWPNPDGWEDFISRENENLLWANVTYDQGAVSGQGRLGVYLGLPKWTEGGTILTQTVSVLPFAAYHKIWNEWFRRDQIQDDEWTPAVAGNNDTDWGARASGDVKNVNWNFDYFTKALPTPQFSDDVLIPLISETASGGPRNIRRVADDTTVGANTINTDGSSAMDVSGISVYLDIQDTAGSIRELREAMATQEYLELLNWTGNRYRDVIRVFFDVDPMSGVIDDPVYIGGSTGRVVIQEVMQTAETIDSGDNIDAVVGSYKGQAMALFGDGGINYTCQEHGYIMGLIHIRPRTSYFQGIPKHWQRLTPLDYAWLQFAEIGDQEILQREIFLNYNDSTNNQDTFGYIPRYSEYRFHNDVISGQMAQEFDDFHLARKWLKASPPALNQNFLYCDPREDDVFVTSSEDTCYANIFNKILVMRSLPKFGLPKS